MTSNFNKRAFNSSKQSEEPLVADAPGTFGYQVLLVVQTLRLIFVRSPSDREYGWWGFLKAAYHDEESGTLYLQYSFGPEVAYSTELPVLDDPRPGQEVWLQLVHHSLCPWLYAAQVPEEAPYAMIRDLDNELEKTAVEDTPALFDRLQSANEIWRTLASQMFRDLMPRCRMYDMGPLPSVYLDTTIHKKPSRDTLLQSPLMRRHSAASSTQNFSKSH